MSNFLDKIDEATLSDGNRRLLSDIKELYSFMKRYQSAKPKEELSKHFLTFAYNLLLVGSEEAALEMVDEVNPAYYASMLLNDMKIAENHWQKAENLKNRVDKASKEQAHLCRMEAEFLIVALGMAEWLSSKSHFQGYKEFREFIERLKGETFSIRIPPKIGLVKK